MTIHNLPMTPREKANKPRQTVQKLQTKKKKKKKQRNQLPSLQENDPNIRKAPQILARRKRIGQQ